MRKTEAAAAREKLYKVDVIVMADRHVPFGSLSLSDSC